MRSSRGLRRPDEHRTAGEDRPSGRLRHAVGRRRRRPHPQEELAVPRLTREHAGQHGQDRTARRLARTHDADDGLGLLPHVGHDPAAAEPHHARPRPPPPPAGRPPATPPPRRGGDRPPRTGGWTRGGGPARGRGTRGGGPTRGGGERNDGPATPTLGAPPATAPRSP